MSHNPDLLVANAAFSAMGTGQFPRPALPLSLEVLTVDEPHRRDEKLSQAVNTLIPSALERRQGIMVVQRDYGTYTVRIDQEVPCGTTHESRQ